MKVRVLVLEKNQVDTMKNALLAEKLIAEKNIKLKGNNDRIYLFLIVVFLMSGQFSKLFFKELDTMLINGIIIIITSVLLLMNMIFKLIIPLYKKQQTIQ
jgi:hypothetical protein